MEFEFFAYEPPVLLVWPCSKPFSAPNKSFSAPIHIYVCVCVCVCVCIHIHIVYLATHTHTEIHPQTKTHQHMFLKQFSVDPSLIQVIRIISSIMGFVFPLLPLGLSYWVRRKESTSTCPCPQKAVRATRSCDRNLRWDGFLSASVGPGWVCLCAVFLVHGVISTEALHDPGPLKCGSTSQKTTYPSRPQLSVPCLVTSFCLPVFSQI